MEILPSILSQNTDDYATLVSRIEESGSFIDGWVHVDFMDNQFVPNKSVEIDALKLYPANFHIEAHLMVADPEDWAQELVETGVERIIFHLETLENDELVKKIREQEIEVGIAINPETPVAKLVPFMDTIDVVLIMSVHPGFGGQDFLAESIAKITEVASLRTKNGFAFKIEVDGGVSVDLIAELESAGVDRAIMGSKLLTGDINENLEKINQTKKTNS